MTHCSWHIDLGLSLKGFTGKDWTALVEPLKMLSIHPNTMNKERICIDKRRFKGFSIEAAVLVQNIKSFLHKAGQEDFSDFEPPKASFVVREQVESKAFPPDF